MSNVRINLLRSPVWINVGAAIYKLPPRPVRFAEFLTTEKAPVMQAEPPAQLAPVQESVADSASGVSQDEMRELLELLTAVAEDVQSVREQQRQSLAEMQTATIELAVAAASWLTGAAIDAGMFAVDDLVRLALEKLEASSPVRVQLNPLDHELLKELSQLQPNADLYEQLTCVENPALPRGSCRIESGRRTLLSDMETRLEEIRRLWMENLDATQVERREDGGHGRSLRRFPDRRETA
jgi:flagellar biosynthesis/type III secretory pathway protein FliH